MKGWQSKIALLAMLMLPAAAWADVTAYAFGNADVYKAVMDAAAGLVKDSSFKYLLYGVGVFTVLVYAAMSAGAPNQMLRIATFMFLVLGVAKFGIDSKTNVHIYDPVFGKSQYSTDVPNLIAYPAAFITSVGHGLANKVEQYFSDVDDELKVSTGGGFNLGNSLIKASTAVYPSSRFLRSTISAYMDNCVVPELSAGVLNINDIMSSNDLWGKSSGTFKNISSSLWTVVYTGNNPDGVAVPCVSSGVVSGATNTVTSKTYSSVSADNAFDYISSYFEAAASDWFVNSAGVDAATKTKYLASLAAAQNYLLTTGTGASNDVSSLLEQSAGINMLKDSIQKMAAKAGVDSTALAFGVAQAEAAQKASWASSAVIFNDLIGYIFSVLQVFIIGMLPIVIILVLMPGGMKIGINFALVMLWVATWEPILAVINYVIMAYSKGQYGYYFDGTSYTYDSLPFISTMSDNFILAASFLATVTPMISWGIIKGGMAFTSFVASALGQQYASMAGGVAATGNIAYNNLQANNASMNKYDTVHQVSAGTATGSFYSPGTGTMHNATGAAVVSDTVSRQLQQTRSETLQSLHAKEKQLQESLSSMHTAATAASRSFLDKASRSQEHTWGTENSTGTSNTSGSGSTFNTSDSNSTSHTETSTTSNQQEHSQKESNSTTKGWGAQGGINGNLGGAAKFSMEKGGSAGKGGKSMGWSGERPSAASAASAAPATSSDSDSNNGGGISEALIKGMDALSMGLMFTPIPGARVAGAAVKGASLIARLASSGKFVNFIKKIGGNEKKAEEFQSTYQKMERLKKAGRLDEAKELESVLASAASALKGDISAYFDKRNVQETADTTRDVVSKDRADAKSNEHREDFQTSSFNRDETVRAQREIKAARALLGSGMEWSKEESMALQNVVQKNESFIETYRELQTVQQSIQRAENLNLNGFTSLAEMNNAQERLMGVSIDTEKVEGMNAGNISGQTNAKVASGERKLQGNYYGKNNSVKRGMFNHDLNQDSRKVHVPIENTSVKVGG